jgi:hypothetical protein
MGIPAATSRSVTDCSAGKSLEDNSIFITQSRDKYRVRRPVGSIPLNTDSTPGSTGPPTGGTPMFVLLDSTYDLPCGSALSVAGRGSHFAVFTIDFDPALPHD